MDIGIMLGVFIRWPFLALPPALLFLGLYFQCKRPVVLMAGLAWLAYFAYEQAIQLRILCSGECNIRVDLLLFYPLLAAFSVVALASYVKSRRAVRRD